MTFNPDPKPNATESRRLRKKASKPKKKTPIKKKTSKQANIDVQYSKLIKELGEELEYDFCVGCGRSDRVNDWSHRIPRSYRKDLICDRNNIDRMCRIRCHELVELGRFNELLNGDEIREYIMRMDYGYFAMKNFKE